MTTHTDDCCIRTEARVCCCGGLTCENCGHLREDHVQPHRPSGTCEVCGCRDFVPEAV